MTLSLLTVCHSAPRDAFALNGAPLIEGPGDQHVHHVVSDRAGGSYLLWVDGGSPGGLYLKRFRPDTTTAEGWPVEGIRLGEANAVPLGLLADDSSAVYVLWGQQPSDWHVARITATGAMSLGWPVSVETAGDPLTFASDGRGGLLLTYSSQPSFLEVVLVVRRLMASGTDAWLTSLDMTAGVISPEAIAPDHFGGAYMARATQVGSVPHIDWTRFDSTGAVPPLWAGPSHLVPSIGELAEPPHLVSDPTGVFLLWTAGGRVRSNRRNLDGTIGLPWSQAGIPIGNSSTYQQNLWTTHGPSASVYLAWLQNEPGYQRAVYASHLTANGLTPYGEPIALSLTNVDIAISDLLPDGEGGAFVLWSEGRHPGASFDVYAQRLATDGALWSGDGVRVTDAIHNQERARGAIANGALSVVWQDGRNIPTQAELGIDLYFASITPDGIVPVRVTRLTAHATPRQVLLRWRTSEQVRLFQLERRERDGGWRHLAHLAPDGVGDLEHVDSDVVPGTYHYRLLSESDVLDELTLTVPFEDAPVLFFTMTPAPSVTFTQMRPGPTRLAMHDIQGRKVLTLDLGAFGPGTHTVPLGLNLPRGVYMARLSQGDHTRTARVAWLP